MSTDFRRVKGGRKQRRTRRRAMGTHRALRRGFRPRRRGRHERDEQRRSPFHRGRLLRLRRRRLRRVRHRGSKYGPRTPSRRGGRNPGSCFGTRRDSGAARSRGRFAGGHSYTRSSGPPAVQPKVARARGETGRLASVAPGTSRPLSPSLASDASAAWSRARARRRARSTRARLVVRVSEQRGSIATRGVDPLVGPRRAHGGSPARARAPRAQRQ